MLYQSLQWDKNIPIHELIWRQPSYLAWGLVTLLICQGNSKTNFLHITENLRFYMCRLKKGYKPHKIKDIFASAYKYFKN